VLHEDFAGRKIRFIGDCVHGVMVEGTAQTTDAAQSAENAMLCAAAMRSSFELALGLLEAGGVDAGELGLAIGLDYGPMAITRLGVKGEKIRCCISRSVLESEAQQLRCGGDQTAIGEGVADYAPANLKALFGVSRRARGFDYAKATEALASVDSKAQTATPTRLLRDASPAVAALSSSVFSFPAQAAGPSKTPAGFA
jgi:class 3 adenylate cyclase